MFVTTFLCRPQNCIKAKGVSLSSLHNIWKITKSVFRVYKNSKILKQFFKVSKIIFKDKREFNIIIKNYFLRANSRSKVRQKFKDDKCTGNSLSTIWKWMRFPCHILENNQNWNVRSIVFLHCDSLKSIFYCLYPFDVSI